MYCELIIIDDEALQCYGNDVISKCKFNQCVNQLTFRNVGLPDSVVYNHFFECGNKKSNNLKRISLQSLQIRSTLSDLGVENDGDLDDDPDYKEYFDEDINTIEELLQMLMPLSPQDHELQQRLKHEITDEMQKTKQVWEIEKLKKNIQNEIDLKYNKFDENELSDPNNMNNNKNKNKNNNNNNTQWASSLEMIELCCCCGIFPDFVLESVRNQLVEYRIVNSLKNLKALALRPKGDDSLLTNLIGNTLLNYICNKLTSLHISDYTGLDAYVDQCQWKFLQFSKCSSYPCTKRVMTETEKKEMNKQSWFPLNVKQLCLFDNTNISNERFIPNIPHFWHESVNCQLFPNLRHLTIMNRLDNKNIKLFTNNFNLNNSFGKKTISNISSLIKNGLQSLQLQIKDLEYRDFNATLDINEYKYNKNRNRFDPVLIISLFQHIFNHIEKPVNNNKYPFILKVEMRVSSIETEIYDSKLGRGLQSKKLKSNFDNLLHQVGLLYTTLSQKIQHNIMFGFKIRFDFGGPSQEIYRYRLERCIDNIHNSLNNKMFFSDDTSKIVNTTIGSRAPGRVIAAFNFKNRNKGKMNDTCDNSYMEPKFEYQCRFCKSHRWTA